jgi:predicted alpha/beta-fold hydrolase
MKQITVPVLFINAMDDPVVTSTCIPYRMSQSNPNLLFAITNRGGHTAFLKNIKFWRKAWSDDVIEEFLAAILRNAGEIVDDAPNIKEDASLLAN